MCSQTQTSVKGCFWKPFNMAVDYPLTQHNFWLGAGCFAYNAFHVWQVFGALVGIVWRFEKRTFRIGSLKVKLIMAYQEFLKYVWPLMIQTRLPFIQIQILPSGMHHKWKESSNLVGKTINLKSKHTDSQQEVPLNQRKTLVCKHSSKPVITLTFF